MPALEFRIPVSDYDLAATLASGQAFRWRHVDGGWEGVVAGCWVRLIPEPDTVKVQFAEPCDDTRWLTHYLQSDIDLAAVTATFPDDEPMRAAVAACRGLRLLRQEPWECLASFILSSTKQIVQIQQIVALVCERFGEPVAVPPGHASEFAFPTAGRLAVCSEAGLRACKMGFRAPYLHETAAMVARGEVDLARLGALDCDAARAELMKLPGVGRKIADCVLLFAYGFQPAFPIDVWVMKALRQLYFPRRRVSPKRLLLFTATHFGPNAGFAQQYLFHSIRLRAGRTVATAAAAENHAKS
ncbi:MAG TPA: DNA glycosylase [Verrucomicrobiae bacterium]|jgi:N-glycosylase/DNA lyase